jgi:hypothetical protein
MFRRGNIQSVCHQFSDLSRGSSLAAFDFAKHDDGTSNAFRELFARESQSITALAKPLTKQEGRVHSYPLAGS